MELLNENEKKAYWLLSKIKSDSLWGIAIHNVCVGGNPYTFRQLISQLKSQGNDQPDIMKRIIGEQALSAISIL